MVRMICHKHVERLCDVLSQVEIESATIFQFGSDSPVTVDSKVAADFSAQAHGQVWDDPVDAHWPLSETLAATLYTRVYATAVGGGSAEPAESMSPDPDLLRSLEAANPGQSRVSRGWIVETLEAEGAICAVKGLRHRMASVGEFQSVGFVSQPVSPGTEVEIHVPHESTEILPDYYFVLGQTLNDQFATFETVRFYFNVSTELTIQMLAPLVSALNLYQVPFEMKCPNNPRAYTRPDTVVLYVRKQHAVLVTEILLEATEDLRDRFEDQVPLFTKRLARGIGQADDPMTGASFGQSRCRLVAEGLVLAWLTQVESAEQRYECVRQRFETAGLDLQRPWLGTSQVNL